MAARTPSGRGAGGAQADAAQADSAEADALQAGTRRASRGAGDQGQAESGRPDLAAMIVPLGRALMAAELPVLRRHGLSMWGYVVLLALDEEPVRTQAALAESIGADKTRIIAVLDDLQHAGLIRRDPDPTDRRVHLLSLTADGRRRRAAAQADIQRQEDRLLTKLPPGDRHSFLRALHLLSSVPPDKQIT